MITDPSNILEHFRSYFEDLSSSKSPSNSVPNAQAHLSNMENLFFLNDEKILDTMISIEEVEGALKIMKQGRSGGGDGLDPEHIYYGGEVLKVWLKRTFNRIIALEEVPVCLRKGIILPVYMERILF